MKQLPRIVMIAGCVFLGLVFTAPLWRITLDAPQFPGGLELHIWVNQISGSDKNIIQNINILNHYIGMQAIEPDSIPELKYFPYIVYAMVALGVIAAVINRKLGYMTWAVILTILGILGVYDFYLWLYDYGHNLDPMAPIKLPGMTYMPPLFGEKDLLNFYVTSYPHLGTLYLGLAGISGLLAYLFRKRYLKTISA